MLLVRTPTPFKTESLPGYLLRVTESNGLNSINTLFQLAGIPARWQGKRSIDIGRIEKILNFPDGRLSDLMPPSGLGSKMTITILGRRLPPIHMARFKPRICPECIEELGFVEAHWDLALTVACSRHRRMAVWSCDRCGTPISLYRPGMLRCECGADLAKCAVRPASLNLLELQEIIRAVVMNEAKPSRSACALPVDNLHAMSLHGLLLVIARLGEYGSASSGDEIKGDAERIVGCAADVLTSWPHGFRGLLRKMALHGRAKVEENTEIAFGEFYRAFFASLFKRSLPSYEVEFLRRVVAEFAADEWSGGFIGSTAVPEEPGGAGEKWASTLCEIDAAAYLGIPPLVLRQLRDSGAVCARQIDPQYHRIDLDTFVHAFPAPSPVSVARSKLISLGRALNSQRFWSGSGRRDLVLAVRDGRIKVFGKIGRDIGGLLLTSTEVKAFIAETRGRGGGRLFSSREAAVLLSCGNVSLISLVRQGWLSNQGREHCLQIPEASLMSFHEQFVSTATVARGGNVDPRRLIREFRDLGIDLIVGRRLSGDAVGYFVRRKDVERIQFPLPSREEASAARRVALIDPVSVLSKYFAELRQSDTSLPRRGKSPNKVHIAKACGLGRHVFRNNVRAIALLEKFDEEDRQRHLIDRDYLESVRRYLDRLAKTGEQLPRRDGKVNLRAVARACGFSRNVFYQNEELLKAFD